MHFTTQDEKRAMAIKFEKIREISPAVYNYLRGYLRCLRDHPERGAKFSRECDLYYCVYNTNGHCFITDIALDSMGMCRECIFVNIPTEDLERLKDEQLMEL